MPVDDLGYDLLLSTPLKAVLTSRVWRGGVAIIIQWRILCIDFTVLAMREFDEIFSVFLLPWKEVELLLIRVDN